jgi:signal transduction histidine kinase
VHVESDVEVHRLRVVLRDLVALSAIPAAWIGSDPPVVAAGLADMLMELLRLDFAFVRLSDPGGAAAVEVTRGNTWTGFPEWLQGHLAANAPLPRKEIVPDVGDSDQRRGFAVSVGVNGEGGVVAAASERSDFPTPMDELLLSLAANHAAAAFQSARLVHERKRAEEELRRARNDLEVKVAERTAELGRLADEQAALRRVATLVAQGVRPMELFSAVSDEVARLFETDAATVVRFDDDGRALVFVGVSKGERGTIPVGTRWDVTDGRLASARVCRTGRSARMNARDWSSLGGPPGAAGGRLGLVSTVAAPIIVEGRSWGAMSVSSSDRPLPHDTEERLEKFTGLVATAIANAEGKSELAASRRRIVAASDEARRRIERDLHDGTQQRLVSLGFAVRSAEANVPPDRDDLRMEMAGVAKGLADAVVELQELSRGIHPAILSQGGLGPALQTLARRAAIPVQLEVNLRTRLPEPVEVAAYYVVSEALANAVKHGRASRIDVSLGRSNGSLLLSIRDDGIGGADPLRGSGLMGLTDRVEALGGSIRVESRRGEGTHLTAELPLELEAVDRS